MTRSDERLTQGVREQRPVILVIDDQPLNLKLLSDYLITHGLTILVAEDGESGLERARYAQPDLIILDVRLPGIDGIETCRRLKADLTTQAIPVLFMTVATNMENKLRGFEAGGVDYINKPVQQAELLARVTTHLQIRAQARHLQQQAAALVQANQRLEQEIAERQRAEATLRESEEFYRNLINILPDALSVVDLQGRLEFVWSQSYTLRDIPPAVELVGTSLFDWFPVAEHDRLRARLHRVAAGQSVPAEEYHTRKYDGSLFSIEISSAPLTDAQGEVVGVINLTRDITERKQAEENLRCSEAKFRAVVENSNDGILFCDANATISYRSPSYRRISDFTDEECIGHSGFERVHPDDLEALRQRWAQIVRHPGIPFRVEYRIQHKNGTWRWIDTTAQNLLDDPDVQQVVVASRDITERKQAEEQIKQDLAEKETLLMELYHRTKNNMQIIIAMLQLQAAAIQDPHTLSILRDTENRIHTMAMAHQMLYDAQDLSYVNLRTYITDLTELILRSHQISPDQIRLVLDVQDVQTAFDIAIPCGLILNELLSNAFEHAFPDHRPGEIHVQLRRAGADELLLCVADNGVGAPAGFDFRTSGSMGLQIVFATAEHQLQGRVEFENDAGVTCRVWVKDNRYGRRI